MFGCHVSKNFSFLMKKRKRMALEESGHSNEYRGETPIRIHCMRKKVYFYFLIKGKNEKVFLPTNNYLIIVNYKIQSTDVMCIYYNVK